MYQETDHAQFVGIAIDLRMRSNREEQMKSARSFISGTLWGGLLGAALAILFAPASGEELREQMRARAERIQAEVNQAAVQRRVELEQQLAALRAPQHKEEI
jgi:gas vesicle protein